MSTHASNTGLSVTLLDVGTKKYGDCILCQFGNVSVLIDGAHTNDDEGSSGHYSIPDQLGYLLKAQSPPYKVTLLIVTHPHEDHIGCLPSLVENDLIRADWALVADPRFRWGQGGGFSVGPTSTQNGNMRTLIAALQEENRSDQSNEELELFFSNVGSLENRYRAMLKTLNQRKPGSVIRQGVDDPSDLIQALESKGVRLNIVGPSREHLKECARLLGQNEDNSFRLMSGMFGFGVQPNIFDTYRKLTSGTGAFFAHAANKGAINLQSIVTIFEYKNEKVCLGGDFQFSMPEVNSDLLTQSVQDMREEIKSEAPFFYYKLSHHGSYNGFSEDIYNEVSGTKYLGIVGGTNDVDHPDDSVLNILKAHRNDVEWVRTDHNGQSTISLEGGQANVDITKGRVNDWTANTGGGGFALVSGTSSETEIKTARSTYGFVEIHAKVPHVSTRVRLTIEVDPPADAPQVTSGEASKETASPKAAKETASPKADFGMSGNEPKPTEPSGNTKNVLVEMRVPEDARASFAAGLGMGADRSLESLGFEHDPSFTPVSIPASGAGMVAGEESVVVRGKVDEDRVAELESHPNVIKVWSDPKIEPFNTNLEDRIRVRKLAPGFGACPLPPCDCQPGVAKGDIKKVADYLGVTDIWEAGYQGDGIVIGVVDGGISSSDRMTGGKIPNVVGGWVEDWGKKANWEGHGNMTSTDALGMAPKAKLYDLRIADTDFTTVETLVSNALSAFDWAIKRHKEDGTPQILTNSWGIYQKSWGPDYAVDPGHPFTRKVIEALDQGIIVLFAAGNCGGSCPDERCAEDAGPGKSIWGANGHPRVMTVGGANVNGQFIGYSSQGPASLDSHKPDFCSISHFKGFFSSDSGTSAACPIAAGVVALFKQADGSLTQDQIKNMLIETAKGIGGDGWNQHAGAGIIQPREVFNRIAGSETEEGEGENDPAECPAESSSKSG